MRIAIIGSGIAGNGAAYALSKYSHHEVVVYERRNRLGGHAFTFDADVGSKKIPVDLGFIVYNELNYPDLIGLFDDLDVQTQASNMGFAASLNNGKTQWSGGNLKTIFAQKKNLFSPKFLMMLREIFRFNKLCADDLAKDNVGDISLGEYLDKNKFAKSFIDGYLAPMGAAIWSTPDKDICSFPALSFLRFFDNHRLISFDRPQWRTVTGGSRNYVNKIVEPFQNNIRLGCEVTSVQRVGEKITIKDSSGREDTFDQVVFAGHTDQTLACLDNINTEEHAVLSAVKYRPNTCYLHRDASLMPSNKKIWAAWNYLQTTDQHQQKNGVCVSYWMNVLQGLDDAHPLFVTLNPVERPAEDKTYHSYVFDHPQFDHAAITAQKQLVHLQGQNNTWFCGAWTGYGFHEDGLRSGFNVAERLGAKIPWRARKEIESQMEPLVEAAE